FLKRNCALSNMSNRQPRTPCIKTITPLEGLFLDNQPFSLAPDKLSISKFSPGKSAGGFPISRGRAEQSEPPINQITAKPKSPELIRMPKRILRFLRIRELNSSPLRVLNKCVAKHVQNVHFHVFGAAIMRF